MPGAITSAEFEEHYEERYQDKDVVAFCTVSGLTITMLRVLGHENLVARCSTLKIHQKGKLQDKDVVAFCTAREVVLFS